MQEAPAAQSLRKHPRCHYEGTVVAQAEEELSTKSKEEDPKTQSRTTSVSKGSGEGTGRHKETRGTPLKTKVPDPQPHVDMRLRHLQSPNANMVLWMCRTLLLLPILCQAAPQTAQVQAEQIPLEKTRQGTHTPKTNALTPFGRSKEPWEPTTPAKVTTSMIAVPSSAATRDKREEREKENKEEAQDQEEMKQHVQALVDAGVPQELREQLKKWIKEEPELTHGDVKKLRKYKAIVSQKEEELMTMDKKWQEFKQAAEKNWVQQRNLYQSGRKELLKQLKEARQKLGEHQKEVKERTAKTGPAEEDEESEKEDKEEEDQGVPPWEDDEEEKEEEEEEEDEDMTVEDLGNGKRSKTLLPFGGGGRKIQKK